MEVASIGLSFRGDSCRDGLLFGKWERSVTSYPVDLTFDRREDSPFPLQDRVTVAPKASDQGKLPSLVTEISFAECRDIVLESYSEKMLGLEGDQYYLVRLYQGSKEGNLLEMAASIKVVAAPITAERILNLLRAIEYSFNTKGPIACFDVAYEDPSKSC